MQSLSQRRAIICVLASLAAFWLALVNWQHPLLRLSMDYVNVVAFWLLLLLPWGAVVATIVWLDGWRRWVMSVVAVACIVVGAVPLFGTSIELLTRPIGSSDGIYTPLRHLALPQGGRLTVYETDCGAPCDFGVVVRQERAILPGVLLVRDIFSVYPAEDAEVDITAPDRVRVNGHEVAIRAWVYM
jgi:hypothetical protein